MRRHEITHEPHATQAKRQGVMSTHCTHQGGGRRWLFNPTWVSEAIGSAQPRPGTIPWGHAQGIFGKNLHAASAWNLGRVQLDLAERRSRGTMALPGLPPPHGRGAASCPVSASWAPPELFHQPAPRTGRAHRLTRLRPSLTRPWTCLSWRAPSRPSAALQLPCHSELQPPQGRQAQLRSRPTTRSGPMGSSPQGSSDAMPPPRPTAKSPCKGSPSHSAPTRPACAGREPWGGPHIAASPARTAAPWTQHSGPPWGGPLEASLQRGPGHLLQGAPSSCQRTGGPGLGVPSHWPWSAWISSACWTSPLVLGRSPPLSAPVRPSSPPGSARETWAYWWWRGSPPWSPRDPRHWGRLQEGGTCGPRWTHGDRTPAKPWWHGGHSSSPVGRSSGTLGELLASVLSLGSIQTPAKLHGHAAGGSAAHARTWCSPLPPSRWRRPASCGNLELEPSGSSGWWTPNVPAPEPVYPYGELHGSGNASPPSGPYRKLPRSCLRTTGAMHAYLKPLSAHLQRLHAGSRPALKAQGLGRHGHWLCSISAISSRLRQEHPVSAPTALQLLPSKWSWTSAAWRGQLSSMPTFSTRPSPPRFQSPRRRADRASPAWLHPL